MVKQLLRMLFPRILKAIVKSVIVIVVFLIASEFLSPLQQFLPGFRTLLETYVFVYVFFIFAGELAKGTIYQYGLGMGKAFFFIGYSIYALNNGIITQTIESVTFTVNLEIFLIMIIFIGTLDFAKSLLQMIDFMANKAETEIFVVVAPEQEIVAE